MLGTDQGPMSGYKFLVKPAQGRRLMVNELFNGFHFCKPPNNCVVQFGNKTSPMRLLFNVVLDSCPYL